MLRLAAALALLPLLVACSVAPTAPAAAVSDLAPTGKVVEGLKSRAWDVAFLAIDPARATDISFTAPYVVIEGVRLRCAVACAPSHRGRRDRATGNALA